MNFVLYRHIRPDKNEIFYIGIGTRERSVDFRRARNKHWRHIFEKNKRQIEVEVILDELTWEEACVLEKWWIAFYGRSDLGKGTLCNLTDGGEGAYGRKKSQETIEKQKRTLTIKGHPMSGRKHTPEARAKISAAGRRQKSPEEIAKIVAKTKGQKRSLELRQQMSQQRKGKLPPNCRSVINTFTERVYSSIAEASRQENIAKTTLER